MDGESTQKERKAEKKQKTYIHTYIESREMSRRRKKEEEGCMIYGMYMAPKKECDVGKEDGMKKET